MVNVAFIRDDATVSDVLEEMYHAMQDRTHMFGYELTMEVICRREIDAQEYLLSVTDKYSILEDEVEATREALEYYRKTLLKILGE